jgi:hypothetical protein
MNNTMEQEFKKLPMVYETGRHIMPSKEAAIGAYKRT